MRSRIARHACVASALLAIACGRTVQITDGSDASGGAAATTSVGTKSSSTNAVSSTSGTTCVPDVEVCDGIDNDCDGMVDESDPSIEMPCDTGLPGPCAPGKLGCWNGSPICVGLAGPQFEACDGDGIDNDCNGAVDDVSCVPKTVFVTSQTFTGNLGGLDGADSICQSLASAAGLPGQFKAWLSTSTETAASRLSHSVAPYALVDGTIVAGSWYDLTDGSIDHAIDLTEQGGPAPPTTACAEPLLPGTTTVWTGSTEAGDILNIIYNCDDYTSTMGPVFVGCSGSSFLSHQWTACCLGLYTCDSNAALYCFEQ